MTPTTTSRDHQTDGDSVPPDNRPFVLIALRASNRVPRAAGCRQVGRYRSLDAALHGRVDDLLNQLAANDGWLITAEHLIVGPDADGHTAVSNYVTQIGSDPGNERVPLPYDPGATRQWLLAAHQLAE